MVRRILAAAALLCALGGTAEAGSAPGLLIIGDCIATRAGLGGLFRGAVVDATVGIASGAIVSRARPGFVDAIVSAGTNDVTRRTPRGQVAALQARLRVNLEAIRARLDGRIVWLVPVYAPAGEVVRAVAARHGDAAIAFAPGPDGYHPRSYLALARAVAPLLSRPPALAAGPRGPVAAAHVH